jgi:hypothetical protein
MTFALACVQDKSHFQITASLFPSEVYDFPQKIDLDEVVAAASPNLFLDLSIDQDAFSSRIMEL